MKHFYYTHYQSPLGTILLQATEQGLSGAWFEQQTTMPDTLGEYTEHHPILEQASTELADYFAGTRTQFEVPLDVQGTAFQQQVWQMLQQIPFAQTWSYQQLAEAIDNPKAVRAVGLANGKNPVSIIVPCHRVIGKSGKLTGYAGGVARKQALLELEAG